MTKIENEPLDAEQLVRVCSSILESWDNGKKGWLFILRNNIPVACLTQQMVRLSGAIPHYSEAKVMEFLEGHMERRENLKNGAGGLTLILPEKTQEWFLGLRATFSPKKDIPERLIPDIDLLRDQWREFERAWMNGGRGVMRWFKAGPYNDKGCETKRQEIAEKIYLSRKLSEGYVDAYELVINTLPNIWLYLSGEVVHELTGMSQNPREVVEPHFIKWALGFEVKKRADQVWLSIEKLEGWLKAKKIQIMKVAATKYANPRLGGWEILELDQATNLIIHSALAYEMSRVAQAKGKS